MKTAESPRVASPRAYDVLHRELSDRRFPGSIYYFRSVKCGRDVVIRGDVAFFFTVVAESDPEFTSYQFDLATNGRFRDCPLESGLFYRGQEVQWLTFGSKPCDDPASTALESCLAAATELGYSHRHVDREFATGRDIRFTNALMLCACVNRTSGYALAKVTVGIREQLAKHRRLLLADLQASDEQEPALVLAALARLILSHKVSVDLDTRLIDRHAEIAWRDS